MLSYERGELDFNQQTTQNRIYQDLLLAVYDRQYDGGRVHREISSLGEDKFFRILEEIALAIWHGDGRTTTIAYIEKRWAEFCGPTTMDKYLFKFVQDEVALKSPELWQQWTAHSLRCLCPRGRDPCYFIVWWSAFLAIFLR